jgi:hypothetical protein
VVPDALNMVVKQRIRSMARLARRLCVLEQLFAESN